jgi:peptide/nickel transport system substrate-binding protein
MHENWHEGAADTLEYDLQAAAELLSQAGYQRDEETGVLRRKKETLDVTLLVNSDNGVKLAIADRLTEAMTSLGVTVTVQKLPWKDYMTALTTGAFDLYIGEVRLTADFDVTELLTGSLNYGGFDPELLKSALTKRNTTTGHQRYWYSRALWEDFVKEVPIAPLCFKKESLLLTWGMGIRPTPLRGDPFYGMEQWPSRRVG